MSQWRKRGHARQENDRITGAQMGMSVTLGADEAGQVG